MAEAVAEPRNTGSGRTPFQNPIKPSASNSRASQTLASRGWIHRSIPSRLRAKGAGEELTLHLRLCQLLAQPLHLGLEILHARVLITRRRIHPRGSRPSGERRIGDADRIGRRFVRVAVLGDQPHHVGLELRGESPPCRRRLLLRRTQLRDDRVAIAVLERTLVGLLLPVSPASSGVRRS